MLSGVKVKTRRLSEAAIRIKRLRGAASQGEFAGEVGIPQSRMSEYERGVKPPVKALIRFARFAVAQGWHGDALWFLEKAGLDPDVLIEMSLLPGQNAQDSSSFGTQIKNVLPHPIIPTGDERAGSPGFLRPLPAWMVPTGGNIFYVRAEAHLWPFRPGDFLIIDASETDPRNLLGEIVVTYRSKEDAEKLLPKFIEQGFIQPGEDALPPWGISVGPLAMERSGSLDRGIYAFSTKEWEVDAAMLGKTSSAQDVLRRDAYKALSRRNFAYADNVGGQPQKPEMEEGMRLLGRVIGWISSPEIQTPSKREPNKK